MYSAQEKEPRNKQPKGARDFDVIKNVKKGLRTFTRGLVHNRVDLIDEGACAVQKELHNTNNASESLVRKLMVCYSTVNACLAEKGVKIAAPVAYSIVGEHQEGLSPSTVPPFVLELASFSRTSVNEKFLNELKNVTAGSSLSPKEAKMAIALFLDKKPFAGCETLKDFLNLEKGSKTRERLACALLGSIKDSGEVLPIHTELLKQLLR